MKVTTKTIGSKAYAKLVALANTGKFGDTARPEAIEACKTLELTYSNIDCADWVSWAYLGLTNVQMEKLQDKLQDLPDYKWLVVTVTN